MAHEIKYEIDWDGKREIFEVSSPCGGFGGIHIMLGRSYHGQVVKNLQGWRVYLNARSELDACDVGVIIDMVKEVFGEE